jgi:hypothetical protein
MSNTKLVDAFEEEVKFVPATLGELHLPFMDAVGRYALSHRIVMQITYDHRTENATPVYDLEIQVNGARSTELTIRMIGNELTIEERNSKRGSYKNTLADLTAEQAQAYFEEDGAFDQLVSQRIKSVTMGNRHDIPARAGAK